MTDKTPFDLDAAFAALKRDERSAWPRVSESLQMRVLGDAAEVAAERTGATVPVSRTLARSGAFHWFGLFDAWSGAAVAAVMLCLLVGIGVGYEAGPEMMARAGLDDTALAAVANDSDGFMLFDDVI